MKNMGMEGVGKTSAASLMIQELREVGDGEEE